MREIELTQGLTALVDDEDYEDVNSHKWHAYASGRTFYARGTVSPCVRDQMHRYIMKDFLLPGLEVDHIDGDGLNNQRINLRIVTAKQNQRNKKKQTNAKASRFKGVRRPKDMRRWRASMYEGKKEIIIGLYDTEIEAAKAYDDAIIEKYGIFAKTNKDLGLY